MERNTKATVFVVDEDPAHRTSLKWLIESMSFSVECYGSVQELFEGFRPGVPGCLVIDLGMPSASRFDLLEQLKSSRIGIPVILISDFDSTSLAQEAGEQGASWLTKPFRDEDLLERLRSAVGKKGDR